MAILIVKKVNSKIQEKDLNNNKFNQTNLKNSKTTTQNLLLKDNITANKIKDNKAKILTSKQIKIYLNKDKNLNPIKDKTQKSFKLPTNLITFGLTMMTKATKQKLNNNNLQKL